MFQLRKVSSHMSPVRFLHGFPPRGYESQAGQELNDSSLNFIAIHRLFGLLSYRSMNAVNRSKMTNSDKEN